MALDTRGVRPGDARTSIKAAVERRLPQTVKLPRSSGLSRSAMNGRKEDMQTMAVPSQATSTLPSAAPNRMFYLDTLRIVLTILVIAHHVGQAYGPTGGYWPVQEAVRAPILGPFFMVNRSFFMSLFFMISGYFMVGAYDRHGFGAFIRSRAVRLGCRSSRSAP